MFKKGSPLSYKLKEIPVSKRKDKVRVSLYLDEDIVEYMDNHCKDLNVSRNVLANLMLSEYKRITDLAIAQGEVLLSFEEV